MMDLQCAVSVQEGDDNKDPAVALIAPSLPGLLILKPCLFNSALVGSQVVSMTNADSMPTLPSSPAEACNAKLATTSPTTTAATSTSTTTTTTTNGTVVDKSPTTSDIASASDSLASTGTSLAETTATTTTLAVAESLLPSSVSSGGGFTANPFQKGNSPFMLNFKGISVTLENNSVWKQFHSYGTEMILTKSGRRMFPYCRYRLAGLVPSQHYSLVLSIVPADLHKYRWNAKKWEVIGAAEYQAQGLIRAFPHQNSPCLGSEWMNSLVSFYKLKLTNNMNDQDGHMILHSMHRYIPRLHVIPVLDGDGPTPDQPVVKGPESMTFTFPQTEFVTVTTYQNPWIIQLKINHNPFAKGFREEGVHPRLCKPKLGSSQGTKDAQSPVTKPAGNSSSLELSSEKTDIPCIKMATSPVPRRDARESGGEQRDAPEYAMEAVSAESRSPPALSPSPTQPPKRPRGRPRKRLSLDASPQAASPRGGPPHGHETRSSRAPPPEDSDEDYTATPASVKKKKRVNRKWGNSRGRDAKLGATAAGAPAVAVANATQPESDDVEGLLFVSFTSKEALGLHVGDVATGNTRTSSAQESPVSLMMMSAQTGELRGTEEKAISRLQVVLLDDLRDHKNRPVIHPHLKEGVHLPLPPPDLPGQGNTTPLSPTVGGAAFVSRTGKTSDLTKIKGWRDKFIKRSKESSASSPQDGPQKDLSAFCSNMLDEYLENEAQQISERAAAFSASPEGSVAYQLPEKSSSYVKTLDSVLKQRSPAAHKAPLRAGRPCPLSHKPLLYSALTSPAPPLALDKPAAPRTKSSSPRTKAATPKALQDAAKSPAGQTAAKASPIFLWFPAEKGQQRPASQGAQPSGSAPGQKAWTGGGQLQAHLQVKSLTKVQLRMLSMEETSENQGVCRTSLTQDRVDFALSALLTATMKPKQQSAAAQFKMAPAPACGQSFCRLGCVCPSLARVNRGPLHCRRPDCMLGCDCFKRKIFKQLLGGGGDDETPMEDAPSNTLYSVTSLQHKVQPSPGAHWDRIWHADRALPDPDPLYAPKSIDRIYFLQSRRAVHHQIQPIQEKDKDPVYRYLESFMTCARIRPFQPPPKDPAKDTETPRTLQALRSPALGPAGARGPATASSAASLLLPQPKKPNGPTKKFPNIILTFKNTGKNSTMDNDSLDSTQIEILSECHWDGDRKLILGALCQRMKRGSLAAPFCVGPYHVSLLAKILRPGGKGSTISYKMRICRLRAASKDEDDAEDTSDEEEVNGNDSDDGEIRSSCKEEEEEEEEEEVEERQAVTEEAAAAAAAMERPFSSETRQIGVTPFLSHVLPAGILQAKKKPKGSSAVGLVQVNGKSYPRACLMLGTVGSLHPANRLAAYVTGRLPAANQPRNPPVLSPKGSTCPAHRAKTAAKLKAKAGVERDGQRAQPSPASRPIKGLTAIRLGATAPACSTSYSSPVSITVSRSLKEPSFLAESGTYSFRICPPVGNQGPAGAGGSGARHPAGVTLPGGFTLIQLPKHGANGALALPVDLDQFPSLVNHREAPVKQEASFTPVTPKIEVDLGDHTSDDQSGSSPKLTCDEKMQSGDSDDSPGTKAPARPDSDLEDEMSFEGSSCSDRDEDRDSTDEDSYVDIEMVEEVCVDVETVEDMTKTIEQMRRTSCPLSRSIWDSSEESGSSMESKSKPPRPEEEDEERQDAASGQRRTQHKVLERLRRLEQRDLFTKLQTILRTDPRAPKLRLLSQAQSEIQNLVETSKSLEKQKKKLAEMQKLYIRKISCLAGKPEDLIRRKLKEVYERICQRKNSLALNKGHQLNVRGKVPPLRQPQVALAATAAAATAPAPSFAPPQNPRPKAPEPIAPPAPASGGSPRSQPQNSPQGSDQRPRGATAPPQENAAAALQAPETKPQEKAGPTGTPSGCAGEQQPPAGTQAMTLPLIRTKTGRIILPSSLKPLGQGFYTITIMEPGTEKAGNVEPGEVILPAHSDPSSSADQGSKEATGGSKDSAPGEEETTPPAPVAGETGAVAVAVAVAVAAAPVPAVVVKKSMSPLVEIARLNKSISSASSGRTLLLRNDGSAEGNGTSRLSFSSCSLMYIPLPQEPARAEPLQESPEAVEPSPSAPRRRRGRPRKHPLVSPAGQNAEDAVTEESAESPAAGDGGSSDRVEDAGESPVLVKRGRGRPPKKRSLEGSSQAGGGPKPPAGAPSGQGRSRPVRDAWNSPDKARAAQTLCGLDKHQEAGRAGAKRPLTRGALGKDFPSAKRRSWIDVEKELGLE